MPGYPNRCQHLKVNGTQCGSPALRRNRFCYFHKRHHDELIELTSDRAKDARNRRRKVAISLPVLEDANSIQVALMQIMRLILSGQLDGKTAGLLLYALQTASANLSRTRFEPLRHDVVLDPARVAETPLGAKLWDDSDFQDEDEEEPEAQPEESEADKIADEYEAHGHYIPQAMRTPSLKRLPANATPEEIRQLVKEQIGKATPAPKRPPQSVTADDVRAQVRAQIEEAVPGLHAAYNDAVKKKL